MYVNIFNKVINFIDCKKNGKKNKIKAERPDDMKRNLKNLNRKFCASIL